MLTLKNSSQTCNIGLLFLRQHPPLLCLEKSRLFPTVVIADIPFLTDSTSVSEDTDLFTEHFPALKGKRDLLLPNRSLPPYLSYLFISHIVSIIKTLLTGITLNCGLFVQ